MVLRLTESPKIENLGKYPEENIVCLRALLAAGAQARLDPHRKDFYEVENGASVFYIHISPSSGKVQLLAVWPKPPRAAGAINEQAAD